VAPDFVTGFGARLKWWLLLLRTRRIMMSGLAGVSERCNSTQQRQYPKHTRLAQKSTTIDAPRRPFVQ
jgi:hypothetical protein